MFDVKIESKKLEKTLGAAPTVIARQLKAGFSRVGVRYLAYHRKLRMRGPPGIRATEKGLVRHRSLATFPPSGETLDNVKLLIQAKGRVSLEHEQGRLLRAKGVSGYMTIPMPAAVKNGRVTKFARRLQRESRHVRQAAEFGTRLRKGKARFLQNRLVPFKTKTGKLLLVMWKPAKRGQKKRTFIPYFHLEKTVALKQRLKFLETWKSFLPQAAKIFRDSVRFAFSKLKKGAAP